MRIKSIHLKNFKRFTDLLVKDIPETAKLVLVVGPNGCGKSSLFDGIWHDYTRHIWHSGMDETYYRKDKDKDFNPHYDRNLVENVKIELHDENLTFQKGDMYIRTAYRGSSDLNVSGIGKLPAPSENPRVKTLIEGDGAVKQNYQRLVADITTASIDRTKPQKTREESYEEFFGPVRDSMLRIFDNNLLLEDVGDPLENGTFRFSKGSAKLYHYKNLSGGEKSAFDLILDLHINKPYYPRAIYCIDETETHLHTSVQGKLIKELVNIIPDEGQLWTTTHSLGVLRACQEIKMENPESVAIIDFHGVNPDETFKLTPTSLNRVTLDKFLSIALGDLSSHIISETIILCEGSPNGMGSGKNFDAQIYNKIFNEHMPNVQFISAGSASEVDKATNIIKLIMQEMAPKTRLISLIDRDDRSDEQVEERKADGNLILGKRNLESYLFADDVLEKLAQKKGKPECVDKILTKKRELLNASNAQGKPHDNLKPIAGDLYVALKRILNLTQPGEDANAFMRDTLAPLITPETDTYKELKKIIIDGVNATL